MTKNSLFILLLIAALLCLTGRLVADPLAWQLDYISKPLLMPLLFVYYRQQMKAYRNTNWLEFISSGLFFAWLGDLFLMIAHGNKLLFITGLLCFLVMQVQYIYHFNKQRFSGPGIFKEKPVFALPSLLLGIGFYGLLFAHLDPILKIAVGLYAVALSAMTLAAVQRYQKSSALSFRYLTCGAFLFMLSDMMIGMNNFLFEEGFYLAGFWIMLSYIAGQFLIVKGLLLHQQSLNNPS